MKTERTMSRPAPLRWMVATAVLALAGAAMQGAQASPGGPGPMGMGGPHLMGGPGGFGGQGGPGGPGGAMGAGMGMGMGMGGPRMDRVLESVGVSAEQKAQIRQIMQAAHTDLAGQREARRQLHEQARGLFLQPNVDARAAEDLRQKMLAQHDQASKRMTQAMLDASRVLTPDQRKALADRMAQRRSMMERHRAERATLDGAGPRRP